MFFVCNSLRARHLILLNSDGLEALEGVNRHVGDEGEELLLRVLIIIPLQPGARIETYESDDPRGTNVMAKKDETKRRVMRPNTALNTVAVHGIAAAGERHTTGTTTTGRREGLA